jgi:hypothetical protein
MIMDTNVWISRLHRGLLYKEWLAHRNVIVGYWAVWLACGLVLPVFNRPEWILVLGLVYAYHVAPRVAGADATEGSEEFAFSLPPTRRQIFLVRLALAGGNLVALLAAGLLTIALGLPQLLWGLAVESVLTEAFPTVQGCGYAFACCMPLAAFACAFVLTVLARMPAQVSQAGFQGVLYAGAVAGGAWAIENSVWQRVTGLIASPALLILGAVVLPLGLFFYERKEAASRPEPVQGGNKYWWWILVALGLLAGLLAVLVLA